MSYIGWKRGEKKRDDEIDDGPSGGFVELYFFHRLVDEPVEYGTGYLGFHPFKKDFNYWKIWDDNGYYETKEINISGVGIKENCFYNIEKGIELIELSRKIGISSGLLEQFLTEAKSNEFEEEKSVEKTVH